jgi:hypothetical protein
MELPEEDRAAQEAWDQKAQARGTVPAEELYKLYSGWTAQLHVWCREKLGRHVDAEFFPIDWKFKVYSGHAGTEVSLFGVPHMVRPEGERSFTLKLPTPDEEPDQERLAQCFRNICLATARVLEIELGVPKLGGKKKGLSHGRKDRILPAPDSSDEPERPRLLPPGVDRPGSETEDPPTGKA